MICSSSWVSSGDDDLVEGPARGHQHLDGRDPALPVDPLQEPLADDPPQRPGQREAGLVLLVGREEVDDPVDGLGGVDGVQRREHQVPGVGRREGGPDGLRVAHLADEDHVGVLAQHPLEGRGVVLGVGADLPLVDERPLVGVEDLDRVLDGDDVPGLGLVDRVDHGGDGRGLAGPGRAGDEDEPPRLLGEAPDGRRAGRGRRRTAFPEAPGAAPGPRCPAGGRR